jgi:hypothetical protein
MVSYSSIVALTRCSLYTTQRKDKLRGQRPLSASATREWKRRLPHEAPNPHLSRSHYVWCVRRLFA